MTRKSLMAVAAALGIAAFSAGVAWACSIPVFRYALQFWDPGPYEILVFHRGSLEPAAEAKVAKLEAIEPGVGANLIVRRVDVAELEKEAGDDGGESGLLALWQERAGSVVPSVVVRYPGRFQPGRPFASEPLASFDPERWLTSPARKSIAERLARGESAVWVFLDSGDETKDREAAARLEKHLEEAKKELRLPEILPEDQVRFGGGLEVDAAVQLAFSVVHVSRKDPTEAALVAMLLDTEDDLKDYDEPMAFAVFGRGRALPALVGGGINRDMVLDQAAFLTGPCSCQVKEQNPGVDILMAVDWRTLLMKSRLESESDVDEVLVQTITGDPTGEVAAEDAGDVEPALTQTAASSSPATAAGTSTTGARASAEAPGSAPAPDGDARGDGPLRTILYAVGMGVVALVFGTIFLRGRGLGR